MKLNLSAVFKASGDISIKKSGKELVIVPLAEGIGKAGEEAFVLNATGQAVWSRIDGKHTIEEIIRELGEEFDAPFEEIKAHTMKFVEQMLERHIILKVDSQ